MQNEIKTSSTTSGAFNHAGRQSTVSSAYILDWLENQKNDSTPIKNNFIQNILDNILIDSMYVETFDEEENLIIVPIKNEYFSQNINTNGPFPIQYLLFREDANGNISRGNVALFYRDDQTNEKLPENSFHDFFKTNSIYVNGTFVLLTLGDIKQYEIDFEDGGFMAKSRLWEREASAQAKCQDWWLVTITYYSDGTYEIDNEYLGNFCSGCPPNQLCDVLEGGGGGSISLEPQLATANVYYLARGEQTTNSWWFELFGNFRIDGIEDIQDPSTNIITSIVTQNSTLGHYGTTGNLSDLWHGTWHPSTLPSGNLISSDGRVATGYTVGNIKFHNQTPVYDLPINTSHSWLAATVF